MPIALHWPVIEKGEAPDRPMLPVMSARLLIALTVSVPLRAVVDAHRPADEGRAGVAVEERGLVEERRWRAR